MSNQLTNVQRVAALMLAVLRNNTATARTITPVQPAGGWNPSNTGAGRQAIVEIPAEFTANKFDPNTGIVLQDTVIGQKVLTLNDIPDVSFFSSIENYNLDSNQGIRTVATNIVEPAANAIIQYIDEKIVDLYKTVENVYRSPNVIAPAKLADITSTLAMLYENKAPKSARFWGLIEPKAWSALASNPEFVSAQQNLGAGNVFSQGMLNTAYNTDFLMNQNVVKHKAGTYTALTDVTADATKGGNTIVLTSAAGTSTGTLVKGDVIFINGVGYVVKTNATAVAGKVTATINGVIKETVDDEEVSFEGDYTANMIYHSSAFGIGMVDLDVDMPNAEVAKVTDPVSGITVRIARFYDYTKKNYIWSLDALFGVTEIRPQLATLVIGTSA